MLQRIALALVIIGAINWGLIGFQFDLVAAIFGEQTAGLSLIIYALVGPFVLAFILMEQLMTIRQMILVGLNREITIME